MKLTLGLYALYLLLIAIKGNGSKFVTDFQADAPGFLPWLVAAAVLGALYEYDKTRSFASAFIILAILSFVLKNYSSLSSQFGSIYRGSTTPAPIAEPATFTAAPRANAPLPIVGSLGLE